MTHHKGRDGQGGEEVLAGLDAGGTTPRQGLSCLPVFSHGVIRFCGMWP